MMRYPSLISACVILLACGDDTSVPQPQPVPSPLRSMIRLSTPSAEHPLLAIVGLPGAVAGAGRVIAKDPSTNATSSAASAAKGSFSVVITDTSSVELSYDTNGRTSEPVLISKALPLGDFPQLIATKNTNGSVVSSPDDEGNITVSNGTDGQLIEATPATELLVTNATTGEMVTDTTDSDGKFSVKIAGRSGDTIHLLLVKPDETELTSDFLSYEVP